MVAVVNIDERGRAVGRLSHHIEFDMFTTSDGWMTSWPCSYMLPDQSAKIDFRLAERWTHQDGQVGMKLTDAETIAIINAIESDDNLVARTLGALLERLFHIRPRVYILPSGDRLEVM